MSYVTNADIELRLGTTIYLQLTDDDGDGVADAARVNEAREGAEGEANGYLAQRTAVPVDLARYPELAAVLKSIVLDLIAYRLYARRPPVPEDVSWQRLNAVRWLERVAGGDVRLPAAAEPPANPAAGPSAAAIGSPRVLTRDALRDV